jgi:hypothetical protein
MEAGLPKETCNIIRAHLDKIGAMIIGNEDNIYTPAFQANFACALEEVIGASTLDVLPSCSSSDYIQT